MAHPSFWAEKEVTAAKDAGLVPALVDDPAYQDSTTREQFAQLIVQLITVATGKEMEAPPADTFQDTDSEAVRKAYQAGIINGMGDGTFAPKQTMTREQMATMIHLLYRKGNRRQAAHQARRDPGLYR